MKRNNSNRRVSLAALLGLALIVVTLLFIPKFFTSQANGRPQVNKSKRLNNYDIRLDSKAAIKMAEFRSRSGRNAVNVADDRDQFVRGESALKQRVPSARVEYGERLNTPEVIGLGASQAHVSLIGQANSSRAESLRSFAKENAGLVGVSNSQADSLTAAADYSNPDGNLSFTSLEQSINGVPVFQGEIKAGFNKHGDMFRVINNLAPGLDEASLSSDFGDAAQAVQAAAGNLGVKSVDLNENSSLSSDLKRTFGSGDWPTTAEKMYFPTEPGVAVPAWRVLMWEPSEAYYVVVDAATGTALWRKDITDDQTQPATYNVYAATNNLGKALDSPSPGNPNPIFPGSPDPASIPSYQPEPVSRTSVTLIGNEGALSFNNLGWMTDNTNGTDGETQGNAVIAGIDAVSPDGIEATTLGSGRIFSFNYTPGGVTGTSTPPYTCCTDIGEAPQGSVYRNGSVTNLFYLSNRYHDALYQVGFTEAARNFQINNFGRGGNGNDRVLAQAQDFSGTNNANFSTPADGTSGRMQMYLFTNGPGPQRDGSLDSNVVFHELTHGVSNRLIGNGGGLSSQQSGGMGEGWSDLFAFLLLSKTNDPANGVYTMGPYATYRCCGLTSFTTNYFYGIRRFPYAAKSVTGGPNTRPYNPLTFADIDPGQFSANNGAYACSPLIGCSAVDAAEVHNEGELWAVTGVEVWSRFVSRLGHDAGTLRTLQLYTDGMKLSPLNPTFLQERDALIAAAQAGGSAGDVVDIWAAFAARGMGFSARNPADNTVVEAFDLPNITQTAPITINDSTGNGNGVADPGELITVNIPFDNNTGQTATGVSFQLIGGASANQASFPNGQQAIAQLQYLVPAQTPCGSSISLTFNVNSNLGPVIFNRSIIVGSPAQTFSQNFDSVTTPGLPSGWVSASVAGGINWTTVTTNSDTAPNSVFAPDFSASTGSEADLTSPPIAINSAAATVSFRHRFSTETGWDGGVLDISIGGGPFTDIIAAGGAFISNGYTAGLGQGGSVGFNPLQGRQSWTGNSNGFITTVVQLPAAANGQNVQLKFRMGADDNTVGSGPNPGWNIDTIKVNGSYSCSTSVVNSRTPFDFDGDGKTDISIFRPNPGEWWYSKSSNGQVVAGAFGTPTDIPTPADFTGDGKTDIAFFRPSTGQWFILRSEDNSFLAFPFGSTGDIPTPADFDNDGKADAAVFRPSTGTWFISPSAGGATIITQFGVNGDQPVAADYDGDGKADIAVYRTNGANKEWWIQRSTAGLFATAFGTVGDKAVPGDYTGDGKADIAVWRPSNGNWFILRSEDNTFLGSPFGQAGDQPVPGDYDGDHKIDVAVFRPSSSTWFVNRSNGAGTLIQNFGSSTDIGVPGAYVK